MISLSHGTGISEGDKARADEATAVEDASRPGRSKNGGIGIEKVGDTEIPSGN